MLRRKADKSYTNPTMKKLLIVDDEPGIRDMLSEHFQNRGYQVFSAGNLPDARAILSKESPKVVILDLDLKGESGADLLKEIKANPPVDSYDGCY